MKLSRDKSSYNVVLIGFLSVILFASSLFYSTSKKMNDSGSVTIEAASIEVSEDENIYTIMSGDTLWDISEAVYGNPYMWSELYQDNIDLVGTNPDHIEPGQVLKINLLISLDKNG